jgi:hypothetical protein
MVMVYSFPFFFMSALRFSVTIATALILILVLSRFMVMLPPFDLRQLPPVLGQFPKQCNKPLRDLNIDPFWKAGIGNMPVSQSRGRSGKKRQTGK